MKLTQTKNVGSWQSFISLHLKLLDIDHPLTFEESKLRQIEAHALIYLSITAFALCNLVGRTYLMATLNSIKHCICSLFNLVVRT